MKKRTLLLSIIFCISTANLFAQEEGYTAEDQPEKKSINLETVGYAAIGVGVATIGLGVLDKIDQSPFNKANEPYNGFDSSKPEEVKEKVAIYYIAGGLLIGGGVAAIIMGKKKTGGSGASITMNENGLGLVYRF